MKFFEESKLWDEVPAWVSQAIMIGYKLRKTTTKKRTLFLLSIPCNTQTASLIALGALRCDLEDPAANTSDNHFDSMIKSCVQPPKKRNKSQTSSHWDVRHISEDTTWLFDSYDPQSESISLRKSKYRQKIKQGGKRVKNPNGQCKRYILRNNALQWQMRDQPISELVLSENELLDESVYEALGNFSAPIFKKNLVRSHDGLLIVTKGSSISSKYVTGLNHIGFEIKGTPYSLAQLLTLKTDNKKEIKRLRLLNENALQEEACYTPKLIIADGINAMLKAEPEFPSSNIVAICNRSGSAQSIDQFRNWLGAKERYYSTRDSAGFLLSPLPQGVILRTLERKGL